MPILNDEAIAAFTSLGHSMRQKRQKLPTSTALLMGTNATKPPLKVKRTIVIDPRDRAILERHGVEMTVVGDTSGMSRQQRRALARSK